MSSAKSPSFDAHLQRVAFTTANADTSFTHSLERAPLAAFMLMVDTKATRIYKGTVAWTDTTISLKSSIANVGGMVMLV
jgi:hypothetical protein